MRVLHIAKVSGMGGTERLLLGLLPYQRRAGIDAHMLVLASDEADRFILPMRDAGVPTSSVPMARDLSGAAFAAIVRTTRQLAPDIVHTHLIHADLYGQLAARLMGIPSVVTMQSVVTFFARQPYRFLSRLAHAQAFATIAISHHVAEYLHRLRITTAAKTHVVWPGIDPAVWSAADEARTAARAALGIPLDSFVIGMTGRVAPGKGHDVLLGAFERLGEDARVHLVMAGDGERFAAVSAQARRSAFSERIHMLGYCPDVRDALAAFDVAVVPTTPDLDEGFGLVAVEAMAFGLPVVASRLAALSEIVLDGDTGRLVAPGDEVALAEALRELHEDPATREFMGAAAVRRVAAEFSLEAMGDKTMAVYAQCP